MSEKTIEPISIREFLENTPPGQSKSISDVGGSPFERGSSGAYLNTPDIRLYCDTDVICKSMQMFRFNTSRIALGVNSKKTEFIQYVCRNCGKGTKTFALFMQLTDAEKLQAGTLFKYGEMPQFGPPTPLKLITLFRDNKDLYLKGRRAENQAMGIAAFAYYRRVIEAEKNRILDEIISVSRAYSAGPELLAELEAAKTERQFSSVIEVIKHGLPEAIFINGHNPLTLLHDALSEGLHAETDDECLEAATDIRMVMAALVERMSEALKEQADLNESVSRLLKKKSERAKRLAAGNADSGLAKTDPLP